MAPWTSRLTDAELVAVADYVRSFYAGALEASQPMIADIIVVGLRCC